MDANGEDGPEPGVGNGGQPLAPPLTAHERHQLLCVSEAPILNVYTNQDLNRQRRLRAAQVEAKVTAGVLAAHQMNIDWEFIVTTMDSPIGELSLYETDEAHRALVYRAQYRRITRHRYVTAWRLVLNPPAPLDVAQKAVELARKELCCVRRLESELLAHPGDAEHRDVAAAVRALERAVQLRRQHTRHCEQYYDADDYAMIAMATGADVVAAMDECPRLPVIAYRPLALLADDWDVELFGELAVEYVNALIGERDLNRDDPVLTVQIGRCIDSALVLVNALHLIA